MAILDVLLELAKDGDPEAMTAWNGDSQYMKLLGAALDTRLVTVFARSDNNDNPIMSFPSDMPMFVNVFVKATVSEQTANEYTFGVYTDDNISSDNLGNAVTCVGMATFDGALLNKGTTVSIPLASGSKLGHYIQVGVASTTDVANEAGRFNIGMSMISSFNITYPRARGIGPQIVGHIQ